MASASLRLLVTGGGTGGHTYPALTTIQTLAGGPQPLAVTWIGTSTGLEARIAREQGIAFAAIRAGKLRRAPSARDKLRNAADLARLPVSIARAVRIVARTRPDVVLSTGGYVALPAGLAAWRCRRPLVIHEQTTAFGLTNRILARIATSIAVSYPASQDGMPPRQRRKVTVTGNPIRAELLRGEPKAAFRRFGLDPDLPLIYVTGGALGSRQINTLLAAILGDLLPVAQVLHQHGSSLPPAAAPSPRYCPVPFLGAELADVLAAADIVIGRSGAGTVAELAALGKPAVLIPLVPSAGGEQLRNALRLAKAGAAVCLSGPDATPNRLLAVLDELTATPEQRARMAAAARRLGRPEAASDLAALVLAAAARHERP